ncbi:hypothetical protein [Pseudoalteromonas lipolytica]|uniref:Uncharacterized protein n=1 Tax=Pseudoalteromonas lipolytica TaxID=570156 RepID=A0ABU8SZ38_9GAMM
MNFKFKKNWLSPMFVVTLLLSLVSMVSTYYLHDTESIKIKAALFVSPVFYLCVVYYLSYLVITPNEITIEGDNISIDGEVYSLNGNSKCYVYFDKPIRASEVLQAEFEILLENKKPITTSCFYEFNFDERDFITYYANSEVVFAHSKVFD